MHATHPWHHHHCWARLGAGIVSAGHVGLPAPKCIVRGHSLGLPRAHYHHRLSCVVKERDRGRERAREREREREKWCVGGGAQRGAYTVPSCQVSRCGTGTAGTRASSGFPLSFSLRLHVGVARGVVVPLRPPVHPGYCCCCCR